MISITDKEYDILREKMDRPSKQVFCPRCGNEIIYKEAGNSVAAECKTDGCISYAIRGI